MPQTNDDLIVIGSGIAGLVCALSLAPRRVTLITKTDGLAGGSSFWAKGGIAAALGPGDSPSAHARDTLAAGAGLSNPKRALGLARDAADGLQLLIDEGVPFDRALDGSLELAREAAHKHARVVHAGGDSTGEILVSSLARRVTHSSHVEVLDNTFAYELVVTKGRVAGIVTLCRDKGWSFHRSTRVILATGGIGMAWWHTTNPSESTGDGLAMAARAGARLADLEFMQFHPTALAVGGDGASLPLLTEALRGAGALLIDEHGSQFMREEHPSAELAPRDVVARAIHERIAAGESVFLDMRPVIRDGKADSFPQAIEAARQAGLDPAEEPLPVTPAAHYHMGGVQTDPAGKTSIPGLWACGEVATTGIHGANRLASNSLLEGLVYARRVAKDVAVSPGDQITSDVSAPRVPTGMPISIDKTATHRDVARKLMSRYVGIARSADGLEHALQELTRLDRELDGIDGDAHYDEILRRSEARNIVLVARLVTLAALRRKESRGAHFRYDFPEASARWRRRQPMRLHAQGMSG